MMTNQASVVVVLEALAQRVFTIGDSDSGEEVDVRAARGESFDVVGGEDRLSAEQKEYLNSFGDRGHK